MFRSSLLVACSLVGAALTSCSVDDRTLQAEVAANGGQSCGTKSSNAGRAATGGSSGTAEAGAANAADCADLDEDKAPDCNQDLLSNPDFDENVSQWSAETGASLTWDPGDALGNSESGSALLATGTVEAPGSVAAAASQCVSVSGGNIVGAYANVFVDSEQAGNGVASVDVYFFDAEGCAGSATVNFSTPQPLDASADTWITLRGGLAAPQATRSVQVRLTIAKQNQAAAFHARFDNVLIKQIAIK